MSASASSADSARLLDLIIELAGDAPIKPGANVYRAGIRWSLIVELRAELDALGLEWRRP